tara:strand:+ start:529 stop:1353 length:825 start_codon:yes stop_codon:yes gene_type:complete
MTKSNTISRRSRSVQFLPSGVPYVIVSGKPRPIRSLLGDGDNNVKTAKNGELAQSFGLSLSAHDSAGLGSVCAWAKGCAKSCLDETGFGGWSHVVRQQRIAKTVLWKRNRPLFLEMLRSDIRKAIAKAERAGKVCAIRLNMFSDIPWEQYGIPQEFPDVQFYDYSKYPNRHGQVCENYWVTFSRDEANDSDALRILNGGDNVAVVFHNSGKFAGNASKRQELPETWNGFTVIDGDKTDARWTDAKGVVVGLKLKAFDTESRNQAIESGFSVSAD